MARGKYAARSAARRIDAADAHIDRLTDQLAEAKLRARRYEAAARELPSVRSEVSRLRRQIDEQTSDALEHERAERMREKAEAVEALHRISDFIGRVFEREKVRLSDAEWGELRELVQRPLHEFLPSLAATRTLRRNATRSGRQITSHFRQAKRLEQILGPGFAEHPVVKRDARRDA